MARRLSNKDGNIRPLVLALYYNAGAVVPSLLFPPAYHLSRHLIPYPCQGVRTGSILVLLLCFCLVLSPRVGQGQASQGFPDQWPTNPGGVSPGFDAPAHSSQFSPGVVEPSGLDNTRAVGPRVAPEVRMKTLNPGESAASGFSAGQGTSVVAGRNSVREAPPGGGEGIRISRRDPERRGPTSTPSPVQRFAPWVTTIGALAVVVGAFFVFVWALRRINPQGHQVLPREVVEVLGHTSLSTRQRLCLIRLGRKVILVAMSTDAVEPIAEIDDPVEVDRLVGLCASQRPHSSTQAFRQLFNNYVNGHEILEK